MFCKALQVKTWSIMACSNKRLLICAFMQQVWICLFSYNGVCLLEQTEELKLWICTRSQERFSLVDGFIHSVQICQCDNEQLDTSALHQSPLLPGRPEFVPLVKLAWPETTAQKKKQNTSSK